MSELVSNQNYDQANKEIPDFDRALTELHEFFLPFKVFDQPHEIPGLVSLLKQTTSGPEDKYTETDKNSSDRNYFFEVSIGARLHKAGFKVEFPANSPQRGDVETIVSGSKIFFQCKRLSSEKQIVKRCKDAMRQLNNNWKSCGNSHGLIALDLSKVINVDSKLLIVESKSHAYEMYTHYFTNIVNRHIKKLAAKSGFFDKRCLGLILYSSQMYYDKEVECRAYMPAYMVLYFHPDFPVQMSLFNTIYNAIYTSH